MPSSIMLILLLATMLVSSRAAADEVRVHGSRDTLFIVASTLNRGYVNAITDRYIEEYAYPRPLVKTTLASDAVRAFCAGIGTEYPDVVAIPRRLSRRELSICARNDIIDVIELSIGNDALVITTKKGEPIFDMKLTHLFYALAAEIPKDAGYFSDFVTNTVERWSEIDPTLPNLPINVLGPAEGSAILSIMKDHFMEGACRKIGAFKVYYSAEDRVRQCTTFRTDGAFQQVPIPLDDNYKEVMSHSAPGTLVVLPYTVWRANRDRLDVLPVEGIEPSRETIRSLDYVAVYPLRLYVKRAHMRTRVGGYGIVEGLFELIHETMSEDAIGADGYLAGMGVVPDSAPERDRNRTRALRLVRFVR